VSLRPSAYGGTTAIVVLPFGVVVREEEAESPAGRGDRPADGNEPGGMVSPPNASGSALTSSGPLPSFGVTGRHRQPTPATGMPTADTEATGRGEEDQPPASWPLPRPPWEYAQPEPQIPEIHLPAPEVQRPESAERPPWEIEMGSWPDAFSRPSVLGAPERTDDDPLTSAPGAARRQQASAVASPGSHLGMPIRVPQASLAPQLRDQRDSDQQATGSAGPEFDARSPEATRSIMILMQQGWERGRVDDLDDPAGPSDNGTSDNGDGR